MIQIPDEYPLVVLAALGMSWQMWGFGTQVSRFRKNTFNEDFMKKEWGTIHKNEVGADI
jgi:hypothetical protein